MQEPSMNLEPQMNFDTHKSIKFLMGKGIKETQAESIVEVVNQSRNHDFSKLATRDQLKVLEERLSGKIQSVEAELRGEISASEERLRGEIISVKHDFLKWMIPILVSTILTLMGIIVTIFFKH